MSDTPTRAPVLHSRPMHKQAFYFGYFWFSGPTGGREV